MNSLQSNSSSRTVLMHAHQELKRAREQLLDLCVQMQKQDAERCEAVSLSEAVAAVRTAEANLRALQQLMKRRDDEDMARVALKAER